MTSFTWLILALASFRLQRIITTDDWPLSEWFRDKVRIRFGLESSWFKLVTCPWCIGSHITILVFLEHHILAVVPFPVYACIAAAAVVGLLGNHDD